MNFTVDAQQVGPPETKWRRLDCARLTRLGALRARRLIVVAPHPDDEVLGAGGLIQRAVTEHLLVEVLAVTNGEASHPNPDVAPSFNIRGLRAHESQLALRRLGCEQPIVTSLHLPDGHVAEHRKELDDALASLLLPDDLCVAPWQHDGHPDHDVSGASAVAASRAVGARSLGYMVSSWHGADPNGTDVPWGRCRRLDLDRRERARKRWSTAAFHSDVAPIDVNCTSAATLREPVLRRFWRSYEVFVDETGAAP